MLAGTAFAAAFVLSASPDVGVGWFQRNTVGWWVMTTALHVPYALILLFLFGGVVERLPPR